VDRGGDPLPHDDLDPIEDFGRIGETPSEAELMVVVEAVTKRFVDTVAVRNVSFSVPPGGTTVLIGPSGSGKSTVLRLIGGLEDLDEGKILVDGIPLDRGGAGLREIRAETGMVFQHFHLFPHLSVLRNIALAPQIVRGRPRAEVERDAHQLLARVGLEGLAQRSPRQLSGGEQQRVAIARALAMRPKVLLFDEPTSALDPEMIREVLDCMRDLASEGMTMVVASHEMGFAREVAQEVLFLDHGEVIEAAPPDELFDSPKHRRTAVFLSRIL
jgi:ABC-type polar amino acid transport system ATPase subunit